MKSIETDPLPDDDFERETKAEAEEYVKGQCAKIQKENLKKENQERRKRGEKPLKGAGTKRRKSDQSVVRDSSSEEDIPKNKKYRMGFEYEGQVRLKFNPLFRLAGIRDPNIRSVQPTHQLPTSLVTRRNLHPKSSSSSSYQFPSTSTGTLRQGSKPASARIPPGVEANLVDNLDDDVYSDEEVCVTSRIPEAAQPKETSPVATFTVRVMDSEPRPEEEVDIYSDEEVVAAGEQSLSRLEDSQRNMKAEDEECYSDEEIPPVSLHKLSSYPSSDIHPRPLDVDFLESIPRERPDFPFSVSQASIGPLTLDDLSSDRQVPRSINRFLKEYQKEGVQFLWNCYKEGRGGILGDDMGLGKTIQVISFLSAIMRKTGTAVDYNRRKRSIREQHLDIAPRHWPTALVVCPKGLIGNWCRELDTWGYFEYAEWRPNDWRDVSRMFKQGFLDIIILSFETLKTFIDNIKDLPLSVVIVDEAHHAKESHAQLTLALKSIRCQVCFALTGTLFQNRIDEMWSVLDLVHRGWAGTLEQWKDFAVDPIKKGHQLEGTTWDVVECIKRVGIMKEKILPHFYLRRDKRLIAHELPKKNDMVVFCPLTATQAKAYINLVNSDAIADVQRRNEKCHCGSGNRTVICCGHEDADMVHDVLLKYLSAIIKVANHFGLLYHAKDDPPQTRETNEYFYKLCTGQECMPRQGAGFQAAIDPENCGKWLLLEKLLVQWRNERNADNKVLIFSTSVRLLTLLGKFIATSPSLSNCHHSLLSGNLTASERSKMVDDFQDPSQDHFIFLISTKAGGVGLNLTAANKVIIFDPSWNPADDLQAMDRAFRIGQKRPVDVYRLIAQGTIEEVKYERQINKQQHSRQLNDGTFEPRIYQGYDGAKKASEQGDLYGVHNIFRYEPRGFVPENLGRVKEAEDQFIEMYNVENRTGSQYSDHDLDEDAHPSKKKLTDSTAEKSGSAGEIASEILGGGSASGAAQSDADILSALCLTTMKHENAFNDSASERELFEIGVQLLQKDPELAKKLKLNHLRRKENSGTTNRNNNDSKKHKTREDKKPCNTPKERRKGVGSVLKTAPLVELSDSD